MEFRYGFFSAVIALLMAAGAAPGAAAIELIWTCNPTPVKEPAAYRDLEQKYIYPATNGCDDIYDVNTTMHSSEVCVRDLGVSTSYACVSIDIAMDQVDDADCGGDLPDGTACYDVSAAGCASATDSNGYLLVGSPPGGDPHFGEIAKAAPYYWYGSGCNTIWHRGVIHTVGVAYCHPAEAKMSVTGGDQTGRALSAETQGCVTAT